MRNVLLAWALATLVWCGEAPKILWFQDWEDANGSRYTSKFEDWGLSRDSKRACAEFPNQVTCIISPTRWIPVEIQTRATQGTVWEIIWINTWEGPQWEFETPYIIPWENTDNLSTPTS